ncbi:MAG TPA: succinylglutamate desuccinylase/aspartoacylase family protein [Dongiaceae bacterium]|jgi:hypothetical protein|nr:succinylglutamate desuccinylase/aspartoacylase family protein [Dongiaceae bacterium]
MKNIEKISLGSMSPGSERYLKVHRYGAKGGRPKAYFQASLHADEIPGMMVAHHLIALLDRAAERGEIIGEIVVVPVANPIGLGQVVNMHHIGRYELRGGGNFNRRWPNLFEGIHDQIANRLTADPEKNVALVRKAIGEKLAAMSADSEFSKLRIVLSRLAHDADFVFDMHCDDESLFHIFALPEHWPDLTDIAALTGARAVLLAEEAGGQSFDETFSTPWIKLARAVGSETPIPPACRAMTLEFRGQGDVSDGLAQQDATALFRFLQLRGLVAGDAGPLPALQCQGTALEACDIPRTPVAGIVAYRVEIGQHVEKGTTVADIIDPLADDPRQGRTPIVCATSGLILSRRSHKLVAPGDTITKVVGTEKLSYRSGLLLED